MSTIPQALALATHHHQAGRLRDAELIYRQILAVDPNHFDAWHLLGVIACQCGNQRAGIECIERALKLQPNWAEARYNLGNAWRDLGKGEEAAACYRHVLQLKPDFAEAHFTLGNITRDLGNHDEAARCYQRALQLKPDHIEALVNLGDVFKEQGKLDEAAACYRRAMQLNPNLAAVHNNLGNVFADQGKLDEAAACYQRALQLSPDLPAVHNNLGNVFRDLGKLDEAAACLRRALQLKPDYAEAHNNLGNIYRNAGKLDEAAAYYRRALQLKPNYERTLSNLGSVLKDAGKLDEALACYRRALQLKPDFAEVHSNFLMTSQYCPGATLAGLAAAHAEYGRQHADSLRTTWTPHANAREPYRRLRLGFVSPDFGRHPVGFFLIRALENLDRSQCETVCYSDRMFRDDLAQRFQSAATEWRNIGGWSDNGLAEKIRADQIDILFDLTGHTARNRLLVFARRPAPIQITWIGYEGTTGVEAIDYILADRYTIPPGHEKWYRERVLRMPDGYVCYDPPATAPEVTPLPAATNGFIRFGSFNFLGKITPQVVEVWAKILERVPGSWITLKYRGLGEEAVCRRYLDLFTASGLDVSRVELTPPSSYADYLAAYGEVDIALDPFPFGGGITTCDALWMGVPVIACPGETFASRHSLSHLANVGLTEMVATTLDEYVELAVSLASDLPRLSRLRAGLRERMTASPLCDGKRYAANLMHVLRDAWRAWCQQKPTKNS